jgi:gamma-glutamylputrescine oxidase
MNRPTSLSFWEYESFYKNIDVLIIGSGIVGLSAALRVKEIDPLLNVVVCERGALPEGASTRNAGFACFGSVTELLDDLETMSESDVFALVEQRFRGLQRLRERVGDARMDYEALGGYELFKAVDNRRQATVEDRFSFERCADSLTYFNKNLKNITGLPQTYRVVPSIYGFAQTHSQLIWNAAEGQINTGKMMVTLLELAKNRGIRFLNGLKIEKISSTTEGGTELATSEDWSFFSQKVVVANNGFARRLLPDLEVIAARNQVLVTEPIPNLPIKGCFHYDKGYFYFRNIGNRLLLGGGRNLDFEGEKTDNFGQTDVIQQALHQLLKEVILPHKTVKIDHTWSGILGIGSVKKPIIEKVMPHVVVAVRMGGMGVAIGSLVGEAAADKVMDDV